MQYKLQLTYPTVSRHAPDILTLFGPAAAQIQATCRALTGRGPQHVFIGLDLEFDQSERPTVLGVSDGVVNVSVPWRDGLPYFRQLLAQWPEMVFVGHSFVSADWFVFKGEGIALKLENVEDTIIRFWLCNMALCKGTGKSEDGDGEKRGKGYMNLWTFMSMYTSLPNWKECRGPECDGTYCVEHAVYEYNGMDAYGPVIALPEVLKQSRMRNLDKLYVLHRELSYVLGEMQRYGVAVDEPYVDTLRVDLKSSKELIARQLPFSVTSPKQVVEHFARKGIVLTDAQEDTIREAVEAHPQDEELLLTLDFKELGNGPDRWFGPKFVKNGRVHSRLGLFTSSARMMSSNPNLQNISIRRVDRHTCTCGHKKFAHGESGRCGECACEKFKEMNIGKKIRRAIVASRGKKIARYDESNGENRVMLHMAGYTTPVGTDLHTWTADLAQLTDDMEFCVKVGGRRQAAKSVVHASSYLEGIQLKTAEELRQPRIKKEISVGARVVYPGWTFGGKIVTFTGANFAERVFGDKSWENRAKALDIVDNKYFGNFPKMRALQQRITEQCERDRAVIPPLGYYTASFGDAEDRCKTAASIYGQQPVAHVTKLALIASWRAFQAGRPMRPVLQVHDELLFEVDEDVPDDECGRWMQEVGEVEMPELPGLIIPIDCSVGPNWRDQTKLKLS